MSSSGECKDGPAAGRSACVLACRGGNFAGAEFSGGLVSFDAKFSGGRVIFRSARFSGGEVIFRSARFSGGEVDFGEAEFSGGEVNFAEAEIWSHPPVFGWDGEPPTGVVLPDRRGVLASQ